MEFIQTDLSLANQHVSETADNADLYVYALSPVLTIRLNKSANGYIATYSESSDSNFFTDTSFYNKASCRFLVDKYIRWNMRPYTESKPTFTTEFVDLTSAIEYVYAHFSNINLYVDGIRWVSATW